MAADKEAQQSSYSYVSEITVYPAELALYLCPGFLWLFALPLAVCPETANSFLL